MADVPLAVAVGAVVYAERVSRSMTQEELARGAGLHPMALSKIERGAQRGVGIETTRRIAEALSASGRVLRASDLIATAERWRGIVLGSELSGLRGQRLAAEVSRLSGR